MGNKFGYAGAGGTISFVGPAISSSINSTNPTGYSTLTCGGIHETADIQERNDITSNAGGQDRGNIFATGRRHAGMLSHVLSEETIYKLIPYGFWGNEGTKDFDDWKGLGDEDPKSKDYGGALRASLLDPGKVFFNARKRRSNNNLGFIVTYNGEEFEFSMAQRNDAMDKVQSLTQSITEQKKSLCWVKLELGSDTSPYVNGVFNLPGVHRSVNQTGEQSESPAVYGNKTFTNSKLHLKYDPTDSIGGAEQLTDPEGDAELQVDKKVIVGVSEQEIFSVKENTINLSTITNISNIPQINSGVPSAGDETSIGEETYVFKNGDLYIYKNSEDHFSLGVVNS